MKKQTLIFLSAGALLIAGCKREGCTDPLANNFNEKAKEDDGTCEYDQESVTYGGSQDEDVVLTNLQNGPNETDYFIEGNWTINSNVTIEPGTVIEMSAGARINVNSTGSLTAIGTSSEKIIIRGAQSTPGYWDYIRFNDANNTKNELSHVIVQDGGGNNSWNASVYCYNGGRLKINNTTIKDGSNYGFIVYSADFELDEFSNVTIENCTVGAAVIQANDMGNIEGNSTFTGNGKNYYEVNGGTISLPQTWKKTNAPFFMNNKTTIESDVTVQPGATFLMGASARMDINSTGSLNAVGTASERITFDGEQSTKGYWEYIRFNGSNNTKNEFQYVDISYGGGNSSWDASLYLYNNSYFTLGNSSINNSQSWGLVDYNNNNTFNDDGNNTFTGNTLGDVGN